MQDFLRSLSPRAEFAVVIGGAFGVFVVGAVVQALVGPKLDVSDDDLRSLLAYEVALLAVLGAFLHVRGWTMSQLGLDLHPRDFVLGAVLVAPTLLAQNTASQLANLRHWTGQGVAPVYEGFDINPDGSYNMWFGYMNRNYEEEVDVPVGVDNTFEPGGDRGQPTHFTTRRHKDVFKVTVPKDFNRTQKVTWTLTTHGQTLVVSGSLESVWQIDRRRTTRGGNINNVDSNLPPTVEMASDGKTVAVGRPLNISLSATDDGRPKKRNSQSSEMNIGLVTK